MEKCEGIVLRSFPFKEREQILTIFTKEQGILSLILKKFSKKNQFLALATPFTEGEFFYHKGNSTLYRFQDGTVFNEHLFLRNEWKYLELAGEMIRLLIQSQLPEKPAPVLYQIFSAYLKQIPHFPHQTTLLGSFILKLLQHEGILPSTQFDPILHIRSFNVLKEIILSQEDLKVIKNYLP